MNKQRKLNERDRKLKREANREAKKKKLVPATVYVVIP
jgi:hypothetical protein